MIRYIIRRLVLGMLTTVLVASIIFFALSLLPEHWYDPLVNRPGQSAADRQALLAHFGVDKPIYVQFLIFVQHLVTHWPPDFGYSQTLHDDVGHAIAQVVGPTILLMGTAYIFQILVSIPIGAISALRQYSRLDTMVTGIAFVGISLPNYWFGAMLLTIFGVIPAQLGHHPIFPVGGTGDLSNPLDVAWHLVLPVIVLASQGIAAYARYTRGAMLDVLGQDYIRTARAKGLRPLAVGIRHAFRNCLLPLITLVGLDLPQLFVGAVITEFVFNWHGMGQLFVTEADHNDVPTLVAILLILSVLVVVCNLLADLAYTWADPRVRLDRRAA